ncbi:MAG: hypothetical protein M3Q79_00690 [bacterium]|nr:hypothetical protein [bacterium]
MSDAYTVKFTFEYDSGKYTAERQLMSTDSIREASMSVINEALKEGISTWFDAINEETSLSIYLTSEKIQDIKSGYKHSGFGIKYDLDKDGGVLVLDGFDPLHHDWTLDRILKIVNYGYISEDYKHFIITVPDGLGGGWEGIFDWIGYFITVMEIASYTSRGARSLLNRQVKNVAQAWEENRIKYPKHLRDFIDTKAEWKIDEVKKRLKINEEFAIKLLTSLGLEPKGDSWKLTQSKSSIRRRKLWIRNEKKYITVIGEGA